MKRGWRASWCLLGAGLLHFACDGDRPCDPSASCSEVAGGQGGDGAGAGEPGIAGGEAGVNLTGAAGERSESGGAASASGGAAGEAGLGGADNDNPKHGEFDALRFSAQGDFFTFRLTTDHLAYPLVTEAYSVDLRHGLQGWDAPVRLPGADYDSEPEFSPSGTTLLYSEKFGDSFLLDLASAGPPLHVDSHHTAFDAMFQTAPR